MLKSRVRIAAGLMIVLVLLCSASMMGETADPLYVHFIDVGQGDAILIDYGEIEILIDGGPNDSWVPYLANYVDGSLELVIVTHPHADHIGGLPAVFSSYAVVELWTSGDTHTTGTYDRYWSAVQSSGASIAEVKCGDSFSKFGLELDILNPCSLSSDLNNSSLVLRLTHGETSFLFTGDIEAGAEQAMLSRGLLSEVDVLKVAHHGSSSSTSASFLAAVQPAIAVISVGEGNRYEHPDDETLDSLESYHAAVFQTRLHGTVVVESRVGAQVIGWEEADAHIGETLWVSGEVGGVTRMNYGRVFINIPRGYPNHEFSIMIHEDCVSEFDDTYGYRFEDALVGEQVYVYGEIAEYNGVTEILPCLPDHLRSDALGSGSLGIESSSITVRTTQEGPELSISVSSLGSGTVSGGGLYQLGASVGLTALANEGYQFSSWTENGVVVSTTPNYIFYASTDRSIVANFETDCPTISYDFDFSSLQYGTLPALLRQEVLGLIGYVSVETQVTAVEMHLQGWRYQMPEPKSSQAAWGTGDGRTTWWHGYWYNYASYLSQYSETTPIKDECGRYIGDGVNLRNVWRRGGTPDSNPSTLEWLLSAAGGPG